jgi:hypothetical protein
LDARPAIDEPGRAADLRRRNVFATKELDRAATSAKNAQVQLERGREVVRDVEFFNLEATISAGDRVSSQNDMQFRVWSTRLLREHCSLR